MINTFSSFYYDTQINAQPYNGYMNIDEGSGEITVQIPVSSYTLTTLVVAIRTALAAQATLDYTVSLDRTTRQLTISAPTAFDLLTDTGTNADSGIWGLIGFSTAADLTGQTSYTGSGAIGKVYTPQFKLQSYVDPEDFQARNQAKKNIAANGTTVEVISFGTAKFVEMDIKFITSRMDIPDCINILPNPNGHEDAIDFFKNITRLNPFEFNKDVNNPGTFFRVILESISEFSDGTGYRLRELNNQGIPDVYESGIIRLRVIE